VELGSREFGTVDIAVGTPEVEIGLVPLRAELAAGSTPVLTGTSAAKTVVVTPHGSRCVLALDTGAGNSPLLTSYTRLSPADTWDPAKGFGWTGTVPQSRDRGPGLDSLRRDFVNDTAARTLRLAVPPGRHQAHVLVGDVHNLQPTFIKSGGEIIAQSEWMHGWYFDWLRFELDGGAAGREVDLEFSSVPREHWHLNALLLLKA
jgi:alpha-glucuronidase